MSAGRRPWKRIVWVVAGLLVAAALVPAILAVLAASALHSTKHAGGFTKSEVIESVEELARQRAFSVHAVSCRETSRNVWKCEVKLNGGSEVPAHATWTPSDKVLGVGLDLPESRRAP